MAAFFAILVAAIAIVQKDSSDGKVFWLFPTGYSEGVLGPFVSRNQYAAWVELLLPVVVYLFVEDRRWRFLYGLGAAILFLSVALAGSRAGLGLVSLEAVALGIALHRRLSRKAAAVVAVCFALLLLTGWVGIRQRLKPDGREQLRMEAVRTSLLMVRDRPWTGSGLGTWPLLFPRYTSFDPGEVMNQAHNDWVQFAAEGGLPFVALIFIFAALSTKSAIRSIYGLGTVVFLLHALVDYPMQQRPAPSAWFFAISAAASARDGRSRRYDGSLRGIGSRAYRAHGRDPAGVPAAGAVTPSGPLHG
jgi:hypothetical protein